MTPIVSSPFPVSGQEHAGTNHGIVDEKKADCRVSPQIRYLRSVL